MNKKKTIILGVIALVLSASVLAGVLLTRPKSDQSIEVGQNKSNDVLESSGNIVRDVVGEGIVLLKNRNNLLPLSAGAKIAVFGGGSVYTEDKKAGGYVLGGRGSGDMYLSYTPDGPADYLKKLSDKGEISIFEPLYEAYKDSVSYIPTTQMYMDAAEFTDTAIMYISRTASEGDDLGASSWNLNNNERNLLKHLTMFFENVIVFLNAPSAMSVEWSLDGNDKDIDIDSLLLMHLPGEYGVWGMADVLLGKTNPSGKLVDTYAKSLYDYPSVESYFGDPYITEYTEDIFVGYRYFETFAKDKVAYEFGFGLSYTTFDISAESVTNDGKNITVNATVKNIGKVSGKETVQVYFSAPQKETGSALLSKAAIELAGFKKTKFLAPGESEKITISFAVNDMASFDDMGATGNDSCYVLEAGDYDIFVGNSVRSVKKAGTYTIENLTVTEKLSQYGDVTLTKRLEADGSYTNPATITKTDKREYKPGETGGANIDFALDKFKGITYSDIVSGKNTWNELIAQMSLDELIDLTGGHYGSWSSGWTGMIGFSKDETSAKYGIYTADTFDGPAGIRTQNANTTWLPCATLQASTWNTELIYNLGLIVAEDALKTGVDMWLAPGMNIHRAPLGGRNFEYYSEDPFVTGSIATAITNAVQSKGVGITVKHFCCNQREVNRKEQDSRVSERALREIYLEGFRKVIKEANPWCLMTSYNKVNGKYTSTDSGLIRTIIRGEWEYEGLIMTDWDEKANHLDQIIAGNNTKMVSLDESALKTAVSSGVLTRKVLEENAYYILSNIVKMPDTALYPDRITTLSDSAETVIDTYYFTGRQAYARFVFKDNNYLAPGLYKGTFFEYKVEAPKEGKYRIGFSYCADAAAAHACDFYINGVLVSNLHTDVAAGDGRITAGTVTLPEGVSTIRLVQASGTPVNYDNIYLTPISE